MSVAALLPGTVSVTPGGTATAAVLTRVPSAEAATVASTVNVAVPPASRSTSALMSPEPVAGHVEPAEAAHVHVAPVSSAGSASTTMAPDTSDGPLFATTIV